MRSPRAIMSIGLTVLFPLTFVSNVFVDPATLPAWLHTFVVSGQIIWVLAASAALTAVFARLTMPVYRNKG